MSEELKEQIKKIRKPVKVENDKIIVEKENKS